MNHATFQARASAGISSGAARPLHLLGSLVSAAVLAACAPMATTNPAALPPTTPVQSLVGSPAAEAAMSARKVAPAALPPPEAAAAPVAAPPRPSEPRMDLIVNNAPAREVFLALGADGRYNVLVHPDLGGTVSVTLRRVTLHEALDALREVYGYDYRVEGRTITVFAPTLQSRVFVVNYPIGQRTGRSDVRVSSGAAPANGSNNGMVNGSTSTGSNPNNSSNQPDSSQISTETKNDLWGELGDAVRTMIGSKDGRSVVVSPQSGLLAVRAMPNEMRQVEALLKAAKMSVERQVMLDVKIVQVELREGYESGIDWSALRSRGAVGSLSGNPNNPLLTNANGLPVLPAATSALSNLVNLPAPANGLFGLSLASNGFQAVMGFLETHGEVQTLSSPRLATLNNQKAVLKVGTDDYFVTNVSGGTVNSASSGTATTTTTMPTLTLTPFFSGIALDVTPQIDEGHMITLHVHPSVSNVTELNKQIDLGTLGSYKLPLASSSINETDTIVRIPDGQIVAIGGLMQMDTSRQTSGLPGSGSNAVTASVLGNRNNTGRKKELVVLIKPSIIRTADDWEDHTQAAWAALEGKDEPVRVIRLDGPPPAPVREQHPNPQIGLALTQEVVAPEPAAATKPPPRKAKRKHAPAAPTAAAGEAQ